MARSDVVIGGDYLNSNVTKATFGSDLVVQTGFKPRKLSPANIAEWAEVTTAEPETSTMSAVGQAVAGAVMPRFISKSASAAVGAAIDTKKRPPRTIRVDWVDGKRSLIRLSEEHFVHLEMVLREQRVEDATPVATAPDPAPAAAPTVTEQAFSLVSGFLKDRAAGTAAPAPSAPDVTEQLVKLASLRDAGVLTEEEFAAKKAELLSRL